MKHFKLISIEDGAVLGTVSSSDFYKYYTKTGTMIKAAPQDAQYVLFEDKFYHSTDLKPEFPELLGKYENIYIESILGQE